MSLIFGQEAESVNQYRVDDTTESTLADNDNIPFYDTSATAKRKTSWSNIKSKLKSYFDLLYEPIFTIGDGLSLANDTLTNPSMSFSTTEKKIGKWVDGSDLYQWSATGQTDSSNGSIVIQIPAIGKLVNLEGNVGWAAGSNSGWMPLAYTNAGWSQTRWYIQGTMFVFQFVQGSDGNSFLRNRPYTLTLKYTKP